MRMDKEFPILDGGKETIATIIGIFVFEEDIYLPVSVASTGDVKVFQVMPSGLKVASKKLHDNFIEEVRKHEEEEAEENNG